MTEARCVQLKKRKEAVKAAKHFQSDMISKIIRHENKPV